MHGRDHGVLAGDAGAHGPFGIIMLLTFALRVARSQSGSEIRAARLG